MVSRSGKYVDLTHTSAVTNNILHSLFSQCTVMLNGVPVTQSHDHYIYRAYLETLLTYGSDASTTHLTYSYWYLNTGEMQPCDPTAETHNSTPNDGFIARWSRLNGSRDLRTLGRLNTDLCIVPLFLLPKVPLQIKFKKAWPRFCLKKISSNKITTFKFLDAYLMVRRV